MPFSSWFKSGSLSFNLNDDGIDVASGWLNDNLEQAGVEKSERVRVRLLIEEALLNLAGHFGDEREATLYQEGYFGRKRLRLVVVGDRFNPLGVEEEGGQDEWSESLFSALGMRTHYNYAVGANVLRVTLPRSSSNLVLKIAIAIVGGALIGVLGDIFIPNTIQEAVSSAILQPIADMWVRLLQAISGPIIFLTALVGTLSMRRMADYGGSQSLTLARYFAVGALVVAFTMACSLPIFVPNFEIAEINRQLLSTTLDGVLQIVPGNLIEPFISANTLQLLLIAIVTGYMLAALGSKVPELNALIRQLNMLGLMVAQQACTLVPFFVGLLLCLRIWAHDTDLLGAIWVPLVLSAVLSTAVLIASILMTSARQRVNPLLLALKLKGPFITVLKRGTLDFSSVDDLASSCKRLLGVNEKFARAVLPQGLFLYMPTSGVGVCVFVLFAANIQKLPIDSMWVFAAAVLSVVLAVATPPLTGANLLSFIMAFTYLGISDAAMLDVMIFDIFFGEMCIAMDQAMLQLETIRQASSMGFLDEEVLRAPLDSAA